MPCECSENNKLNNNEKLDNNKTLSLDSMASMQIDEIIDLYKNGYRLEGLADKVDIVSLGCTGYPSTDIYRAMNQQGGIIIYKGTVGACKITPTSRCLDTILFYQARRYSTSYSIYFEIREHDPATGYPKGTPGDSVGLVKQVNDTFETTFPGYPQSITFQAELPTLGVPYWITIRSSDYICGGGTAGQERVELSYSWLSGTNRANYGPAIPCVWNSGVTDSWAIEVFKTTFTAPPVLTTINITPTAPSINMGSTQQFTASCLDQYGASIGCSTLTWTSSNSGFAPINSSGLVTSSGTGATYTSNISCTGGGKTSNTAILTVVKVVYSITITPLTASLNTGGTQQLTAVCRDVGGNPLPSCPTLIWYSTNNSVATVNSAGLVTAGSTPGTTNISCTGGGANSTTSSAITVIGALNTITISPPTASLNIGNTQQLTAVCKDIVNNVLTCPTLTWSSGSSSATVNTSGLVTAVSGGTANISCTGGGKTSNSSVITVIAPANITVQNTTVGGTPCLAGCTITCATTCPQTVSIVVTWANSGGSNGTFTPKITVAGGTQITGTPLTITVVPGTPGTTMFTGVSLPQGIPQICIYIGTIT
jgi:uncharacterized protein YjdB